MLVHGCVTGEFRTRAGHARGVVILLEEWVAHAQDSTKFRSGHARVGGQAVVVVEARFRRPGREIGAAKIGEALLETGGDLSRARVARGNGTTSTRMLPSKFTSPMRNLTALRSSSPKSWSSQNAGTPSISRVVRKRWRVSSTSMPSNNSLTACKVAVETMVGPLAMLSSGKPSGE